MPSPRRPYGETAHRRAIGSRIAELRRERGWRQLELASRADLHRPYVTGIETGPQRDGTRVRIANALGVPLIEFFRTD